MRLSYLLVICLIPAATVGAVSALTLDKAISRAINELSMGTLACTRNFGPNGMSIDRPVYLTEEEPWTSEQ